MLKKILVLCWLTGAAASSAIAQSVEVPVDENVLVYGTRFEQAVTEVGSSVTVITAEQIEALNVEFLLDAIAIAPGVTINQNGSFGGVASVRIRGASSEQTLVIVDGVVVNDPSSPGGGFDFARLDPAHIQRIEILKGPQSTLWGTDAIGGVVNIITKRPDEAFAGNAFIQGGSFDSVRGGLEVGGAQGRFDYRLAVSGHSTDGISKADEDNGNTEDDGFDSRTISVRGGVDFATDARLEASVLWTDAEAEFDSFVFGAQGNVGDGDELSKTEELNGSLNLSFSSFNGKLDNSLLIGRTEIERENFSAGEPSFSNEGDRTSYRYQGTWAINDRNRLAFGAEREDSDSAAADTSIDGFFALYELQPTDQFTLTAGLRRDDHERFGGETTGRLAVAYNPTELIGLSASWGEGFKAPSLFQTTFFCCGATGPNLDLQPEVSEAFDVGIRLRSPDARGEIGLTYYDQDTTDLITFSFADGGYLNIAEASSQGIELDGRYRFTDWLEASVNLAQIDATDGTGAELFRVPELSGDLALSFNPNGRTSATVLVKHNGEERDPNGEVPGWTRVDVSGRYLMSESTELYARIENLFDRRYQQVLGYGTPGVSGFIGARMNF